MGALARGDGYWRLLGGVRPLAADDSRHGSQADDPRSPSGRLLNCREDVFHGPAGLIKDGEGIHGNLVQAAIDAVPQSRNQPGQFVKHMYRVGRRGRRRVCSGHRPMRIVDESGHVPAERA